MGNFNSVTVDVDKNLLTAGASLRLHNVAHAAHAKGKSISMLSFVLFRCKHLSNSLPAVGACSCVGIGGATLGGGIGFYSGLYGTLADSLFSVELIAGTGEVLTASDTENQELFWGIKGAGFNFGTVTSFTYRVQDHPNEGMVMNADMTFKGAQNASIWEFSKKMLGTQPPELSLVFAMRYDAEIGDVRFRHFFVHCSSSSSSLETNADPTTRSPSSSTLSTPDPSRKAKRYWSPSSSSTQTTSSFPTSPGPKPPTPPFTASLK